MSRLTSIRKHCRDCTGYTGKAGREVDNCSSKDCPLRPWRSGKRRKNGHNNLTRIICNYCLDCIGKDPDKKIDREATNLVQNCKSTKCALHSYRRPPAEIQNKQG